MLRALQSGLTLRDLHELSIGAVKDIIIESGNDYAEYEKRGGTREATQDDIDRYYG